MKHLSKRWGWDVHRSTFHIHGPVSPPLRTRHPPHLTSTVLLLVLPRRKWRPREACHVLKNTQVVSVPEVSPEAHPLPGCQAPTRTAYSPNY